jgi:adenylate cyclase
LQIASQEQPDFVILLDINGYEVCRQIKVDSVLNATPVLFLSSLDNVGDKILGFEAGGVDYINKQPKELLARVKTHIDLFCARKENERYAKVRVLV